MKLQIDTELKTIKLESKTNLKEFFEKIQNFLPDWQDYKLETNVTINWNSYPVYKYINNPWWTAPYGPYYYGSAVGSGALTTTDARLDNLTSKEGYDQGLVINTHAADSKNPFIANSAWSYTKSGTFNIEA